MKKLIFILMTMLLGSGMWINADVIEEKEFAIEVPPGFTFKGQTSDYNSFGNAAGDQRIDINTISELTAGLTAAYLFDSLAKQNGFERDRALTDRRVGRFCGFSKDGTQFLMVLADSNNLKICVVIYRWVRSKDVEARKNIVDYLIYSHSLDRSVAPRSSASNQGNTPGR